MKQAVGSEAGLMISAIAKRRWWPLGIVETVASRFLMYSSGKNEHTQEEVLSTAGKAALLSRILMPGQAGWSIRLLRAAISFADKRTARMVTLMAGRASRLDVLSKWAMARKAMLPMPHADQSLGGMSCPFLAAEISNRLLSA